MRIVINAISMETIAELQEVLEAFPVEDEEILQMQVNRVKKLGNYHLPQAENPVWICSFTFREGETGSMDKVKKALLTEEENGNREMEKCRDDRSTGKKIRRIMIAAPKSGSGKTMITCGLLQIFKENGEDISSCKCGPDYIDPMFHRQVLGIPARNLDTFSPERTAREACF